MESEVKVIDGKRYHIVPVATKVESDYDLAMMCQRFALVVKSNHYVITAYDTEAVTKLIGLPFQEYEAHLVISYRDDRGTVL